MHRPHDDPFGERPKRGPRRRLEVLGGRFDVSGTDAALLRLAVDAYAGLPRYRLGREPRHFEVRLLRATTAVQRSRPHAPRLSAGVGLLCASVDAGSFAIIDTEMSRALISVSSSLLCFPDVARRELVELAFLTLASRAQELVPLHAACIGSNGRGVLLMGGGGAGKSTLALQALADGMEVMAEDSAFVAPDTLQILGAPNFLHVRPSSLRFLSPGPLRDQIERSPTIERRSGVRKRALDLRLTRGIARAPLQHAATVLLSARRAGRATALRSLDSRAFRRGLRREQPYARNLDGWSEFEARISEGPCYELRRTEHPRIAIELLRGL